MVQCVLRINQNIKYGGRVEIGLPCKTSQGVHSNRKTFKGGPKEVQYTLRSTIEH